MSVNISVDHVIFYCQLRYAHEQEILKREISQLVKKLSLKIVFATDLRSHFHYMKETVLFCYAGPHSKTIGGASAQYWLSQQKKKKKE